MKRITAGRLATVSGVLMNPVVTVDAGLIVSIGTRDTLENAHIDHEFPDATLTAGLLDIHFHGVVGQDVMNASADGFAMIARRLAQAGVTQFLPTTVTASMDTTLLALERIASFVDAEAVNGGARAIGVHIEGPFLSHTKRGMHAAEHLLEPTPERLDQLWEASRGTIRLMTIAPELPGAVETIRRAVELGIKVSIGHSNATRDETIAGIENGAVSATHTFNAMRALDHREPGILGVVLDRDDLFADLICDGQHVAAEAVRLWWKAKGPDRAILITDCLSAAGMPNGLYKTGDTVVHVEGDACRNEDGVLAGSVITLDRAVENFRKMAQVGVEVAGGMASRNPCRMLGLPEMLVPGAWADFNVYDADGIRRQCFVRGELLG